jgi:hypothetical protein
MPNALKPVYSAQLGAFMDTPEIAATIKTWAGKLNITHGQVMREIVRAGLPAVVERFEAQAGPLPPRTYTAALRVEQRKGAERARRAARAKREARKVSGATTTAETPEIAAA